MIWLLVTNVYIHELLVEDEGFRGRGRTVCVALWRRTLTKYPQLEGKSITLVYIYLTLKDQVEKQTCH